QQPQQPQQQEQQQQQQQEDQQHRQPQQQQPEAQQQEQEQQQPQQQPQQQQKQQPQLPAASSKPSTVPIVVALYFGTFDPIHENHVGLAKFALQQGHAGIVYFVVNGDNPMKPGATAHSDRLRLVQKRVAEEADSRLRCLQLSPNELRKMDWIGRGGICARVKQDSQSQSSEFAGSEIEVAQIMGQDSFEQAVVRSMPVGGRHRRSPAGIFSAKGWRFLVFPRGGAEASQPVQVPKELKNQVTVIEDYSDPILLSSTAVRSALAGHGALEGAIHPRLRDEVAKLYAHTQSAPSGLGPRQKATGELPDGRDSHRFLLLLMGPPGSGKTSLGQELQTSLGFRHISGGDVFRAANSRTSQSEKWSKEGQEQTAAKVFAAIAHAVELLDPEPVSFDGFLPKDMREFEEKVGKVSLLVELDCRMVSSWRD
ncbi:unnamed protein product, partial [Polarella glacialis]